MGSSLSALGELSQLISCKELVHEGSHNGLAIVWRLDINALPCRKNFPGESFPKKTFLRKLRPESFIKSEYAC
jgi:hypothetical protein